MGQWYCGVGGRRYGPVTEEEVRRWIAEGRVGPTDYVWSEGMADWSYAGAVFGAAGGAGQAAWGPQPYAAAGPLFPALPPRPWGTGGATPNTALMSQAGQTLRGRWGLPIGFCLLSLLIGIGMEIIPTVGGVAGLILGGPLELGAIVFFLTFIRGGQAEIGMLFIGFRRFANALGAYLLVALFTLLWTLLLIVPGIIAALSYGMTFYILADDPRVGPLEAIRRSKELMRGRKWKLFCLGLIFFLLSLLCVLTLGIGFIWLWPYMSATYARFYDDLAPPPGSPMATAGAPGAPGA